MENAIYSYNFTHITISADMSAIKMVKILKFEIQIKKEKINKMGRILNTHNIVRKIVHTCSTTLIT